MFVGPLRGRQRGDLRRGLVRARQHRQDARTPDGVFRVDAPHAGVGMRRPQDHGVHHAVERDVVDIAAIAGQEAFVFGTLAGLTDFSGGGGLCHGADATAQGARTPETRTCGQPI